VSLVVESKEEETDDVAVPTHAVSTLETVLCRSNIEAHYSSICGYSSAVPDDLHHVEVYHRAPRKIRSLSHWLAAGKREQLLESDFRRDMLSLY
jgi:hypothetical protein